MARSKYWIWREPAGSDYTQLIEFCAKRCPKCTFVLQRPQQFGESCNQFLRTLQENLLEVVSQTEWPGTKLMGFAAPVYWYRLTPKLNAALKAKVSSLYEWAVPDLPEDLAFYWPDGSPLLGTSSHERFAFVNLDEKEIDDLEQEVPNLRLNKVPPPELV
jgi:hypothetical protein